MVCRKIQLNLSIHDNMPRSDPATAVASAPTLSVGTAYARRLFEVLEHLGLPQAALIRHARVGPVDWNTAQERLPLAALVALFQSALALTGRRDLGLEFGRQARPDTFNVLGYALMTCRNIEEAIGLVPLYRRVVFDFGYSETRFAVQDGVAKLTWVVLPQATQDGLPYCDLLAESLIASWFGFGRWIAAADMPLREVRFFHAAPADVRPFESFFGCPVGFSAGENSILFAAELLAQPLAQADAALNLMMRDEARKKIDRMQGSDGVVDQVRQAMLPLMPKCEATLADVAAALHITPRTLQRRLAGANYSFQEVLEATRRELAQVYLRDRALSALDVALLLGYAEQSSFTRAFRNWFSSAPSVWRQGR